jgi:hypothetical protein
VGYVGYRYRARVLLSRKVGGPLSEAALVGCFAHGFGHLDSAQRVDFCVGYFNLRGWKQLDDAVERWAGGGGRCCRLLVGMQRLPQEDLRDALRIGPADDEMYLQGKRCPFMS